MSLFTVDESKCKRDGHCVAECPRRIIELPDPDAVPVPTEDAEELCIHCGHCVAVCPHGALSLSFMSPEDCPPVQKDLLLDPAHAEHVLRQRRSIRTYKQKPVERETIESLIRMARYAPTGTNSQLVGWLVYNGRPQVKKLAGHVVDWMRYLAGKGEPVAEQYNFSGIAEAWEDGLDIPLRGAPALVVAHAPKEYGVAQVDCTIALTYLDLAAPSFGLGTCWAGFFMFASMYWPPLQKELGLPGDRSPFGAMMLGHPKYRYHRLPLRNEPDIEWRG